VGGGLLCLKIDHARVRATVETDVGVKDRMPGASKGHSYAIAVRSTGVKLDTTSIVNRRSMSYRNIATTEFFRVIDDSLLETLRLKIPKLKRWLIAINPIQVPDQALDATMAGEIDQIPIHRGVVVPFVDLTYLATDHIVTRHDLGGEPINWVPDY